jgi:hypothetical protein
MEMIEKIVVLLCSTLLLACGPSCEEQGGKLVQVGWDYVWQWIDMQKGIGYMQPIPQYICKKENGNEL